MRDSYVKFLMSIDEDFRAAIKESEKEFLINALETRRELLQKLNELLQNSKSLKVKDIVQAIQILNAEIRKSEKLLSKHDNREDETVDDDIVEMEKRLATLESEFVEQ